MNPDYVANKEYVASENAENVTSYIDVMMFTVDWCPYCKKAKPIWSKVKNLFDGKKINNTSLRFIEIDGEKNEKEIENFESKFLNGKKIEGYPSIFMVKNDQVIEYEAKPNVEILKEFIESVL